MSRFKIIIPLLSALSAITGLGCTKTKKEVQFIFQPSAEFTVSYKDPVLGEVKSDASNICGNDYIFTSKKEGDVRYAWDFGDGATSTEAAPKHAYAEPGLYTVTLKATRTEKAFSEYKVQLRAQIGQREILLDNNRHHVALALAEAGDGGFYVCGYTNELSPLPDPAQRRYFLLKLDKKLEVKSTRRFPDRFGLWSFALTADGDFVGTGSDVAANVSDKLICMTAAGDVKWIKPLEGNVQYRDVAQTKDKGFIAMGGRMQADGWTSYTVVTKTDAAGNVQWSKALYPGGFGSYANKLHYGEQGITLALTRRETGNGRLMRFSDAGALLMDHEIVWGTGGSQATASIARMTDGRFAVLEHSSERLPFYIFTSDGALEDSRRGHGAYRTYQMLASPDNNLVFLQDHFEWETNSARLVKYSSNGQEVWSAPFDHRYFYGPGLRNNVMVSPNTAIALKNGGYLMAASKHEPESPDFRQKLVVLRIDEKGISQ